MLGSCLSALVLVAVIAPSASAAPFHVSTTETPKAGEHPVALSSVRVLGGPVTRTSSVECGAIPIRPSFSVATRVTGRAVRFRVGPGPYQVLVGRRAAQVTLPQGAGTRWLTVRGRFKNTTVVLDISRAGCVFDVQPAAGTRLRRVAPTKRIAFFGDSYVSSGTATFHNYAYTASRDIGLLDVAASGIGGSGYVNPGSSGGLPLGQRLHRDIVPLRPDMLVVAAGLNDSRYSEGDVRSAAASLYRDIKASLPKTKVVVIGPWLAGREQVRDWLKDESAKAGLAFIDPITEGWLVGPGKQHYLADGTHPSDEGNVYLGHQLGPVLRAALS